MNLQKLFELQRRLDEHIEKEHPRQEGEDRLAKKILALMVELGELANEARFFKYWSHDQEPRIVVREWKLYEDTIKEYGDSTHRRYEGVVRPVLRQPLLEEFADCLHFLLSIGNDINMNEVYEDSVPEPLRCDDIIEQFMDVNDWINYFYRNRHEDVNGEIYDLIFANFLGLGEMLGFTWEQIEEAYLRKNAINHKRMESGY
ncbi:dUTPase [Geobacillus sp. MMMUD3]|nr:dUTPase [Geobacillus sp. MMMUD3]